MLLEPRNELQQFVNDQGSIEVLFHLVIDGVSTVGTEISVQVIVYVLSLTFAGWNLSRENKLCSAVTATPRRLCEFSKKQFADDFE
jgi:hypothetical protein